MISLGGNYLSWHCHKNFCKGKRNITISAVMYNVCFFCEFDLKLTLIKLIT